MVSMDATPINFDNIGSPYNHTPQLRSACSNPSRTWSTAAASARRSKLISWCEWAKDSLEKDYGIERDKVVVVPPGVDLEKWKSAREGAAQRPVRLLFVGGDFRRKGGDTLLEAFRTSLQQECELDIVTREPVNIGRPAAVSGCTMAWVRMHRN